MQCDRRGNWIMNRCLLHRCADCLLVSLCLGDRGSERQRCVYDSTQNTLFHMLQTELRPEAGTVRQHWTYVKRLPLDTVSAPQLTPDKHTHTHIHTYTHSDTITTHIFEELSQPGRLGKWSYSGEERIKAFSEMILLRISPPSPPVTPVLCSLSLTLFISRRLPPPTPPPPPPLPGPREGEERRIRM